MQGLWDKHEQACPPFSALTCALVCDRGFVSSPHSHSALVCRPLKFNMLCSSNAVAMLPYMTAYYFPVMIVPVLHHRLSIKAGVTADPIPPKIRSGPDPIH